MAAAGAPPAHERQPGRDAAQPLPGPLAAFPAAAPALPPAAPAPVRFAVQPGGDDFREVDFDALLGEQCSSSRTWPLFLLLYQHLTMR